MSETELTVTVGQINAVVGDILGNTEKILGLYKSAAHRGVDLVVTPELSVTGYPLEDLANHPDVLAAAALAARTLAAATAGGATALVIGFPLVESGRVYNAAQVLADGRVLRTVKKRHLPDYGVFDEKRNFSPGTGSALPFVFNGRKYGLMICEDLWSPDVSAELAAAGAEYLISISASPFREGVFETRVLDVGGKRVAETHLPLLYVNMAGGQDDIVFDGGSFMLDHRGRRLGTLTHWKEETADWGFGGEADDAPLGASPDPMENIWRVMMLAVADYARKTGFTDVMLGLSGGIDSAVAAAVAGDALGPDRVHCVRLPSENTSALSNQVAERLATIWGFELFTMPIGDVAEAASGTLRAALEVGRLKPLTTENIQARARGYLLMTMSNDRGWLLLSTGDKSEITVGYPTLYGDICGGFNPLKDVYKTTVYQLAAWRNQNRPDDFKGPNGLAIPEEIIARPPSAELAPGQKDEDSLPPYPILDSILSEMVENQAARDKIVSLGFNSALVDRVSHLLFRSELKRRQSAPGPRTTARAFARDRRYPVVNRFDPNSLLELANLAAKYGITQERGAAYEDE